MVALTKNAGAFVAPRARHLDTSVLFDLPRSWANRLTLRRKLSEMDDYLLRDIGWDPAAARVEAAKPFWRG